MGPNGTGKSTLAYTLMGHPNYEVTGGEVWFKGQNILELEPDERSRLGIFLAFQYPVAIPGVTVANFLRTALNARRRAENPEDKGMPIPEFRKMLKAKMDLLKMDQTFAGRYLNDGFSGGEKKRAEILQMAVLKPEIAILDETDSGLDIDALRIVSEGVNALRSRRSGCVGDYPLPAHFELHKPGCRARHVDGRIVESGGPDLALHLEEHGYDWVREKYEAGRLLNGRTVPGGTYGCNNRRKIARRSWRIPVWVSAILKLLCLRVGEGWTRTLCANFCDERRTGMDAGFPPESARAFHETTDAYLGCRIFRQLEPGRNIFIMSSRPKPRVRPGMMFRIRSRIPLTNWASPKRNRNSWLGWARSMNRDGLSQHPGTPRKTRCDLL